MDQSEYEKKRDERANDYAECSKFLGYTDNPHLVDFKAGSDFGREYQRGVENEKINALKEKVLRHAEAYGLDIFPNSKVITDDSSIDSISAMMGRHMCKCFLEYIDQAFNKAKSQGDK